MNSDTKKTDENIHSTKKSLKILKGNQNPYIEEEQTTQWPKEKRRCRYNIM